MGNFKKSLSLLDQLIEYAQHEDNLNHADIQIRSKKVGDSFMLFHLKLLKKTIKEDLNA